MKPHIATIYPRDRQVLTTLARVGYLEHDQMLTFLREKRISGYLKDELIQRECDSKPGKKSSDRVCYKLTKTGHEVCRQKLGMEYTYHAQSPNHDLCIAEKYLSLSPEEQDTSLTTSTTVVKGSTGDFRIASGVKSIFMDFNNDGTVKSVYVKNGMANVTTSELAYKGSNGDTHAKTAQMYVNKDGAVEAIVVKTSSSDAVSDKVLYVESVKGDSVVNGVRTYTYHVWVNGAEEDYTSTDNLDAAQFATYAEKTDGTYKLSAVKTKAENATSAFKLTVKLENIDTANKNLIYGVNKASGAPYTAGVVTTVTAMDGTAGNTTTYIPNDALGNGQVMNFVGAGFSDLTDNGFSSLKNIYDYLDRNNKIDITSGTADEKAASLKTKLANDEIELTIVMNNKPTADDFMKVAAVAVTSIH